MLQCEYEWAEKKMAYSTKYKEVFIQVFFFYMVFCIFIKGLNLTIYDYLLLKKPKNPIMCWQKIIRTLIYS